MPKQRSGSGFQFKCVMSIVQVPNIAAGTLDTKRRVISKHFRRLQDNYERQTFTGEVEGPKPCHHDPVCPCLSTPITYAPSLFSLPGCNLTA